MAVKYDDRTARGWPLPHRENRLYDDVERLREALGLIDEAISGVEDHEGVIEDKQDSLETRLDTILEGATEESEILDAHVDAEDQVHPNLGHNVRNLHRLILGLGDEIIYEGSEFRGLLRQFSDLVSAQIQGELNSLEAHERRKFEIKQETLSRFQGDSSIQHQVDFLAKNNIKNALARKTEREASRAEHEERIEAKAFLQSETDAGIRNSKQNDEALQGEIDTLSRAQISQALNAKSEAEARRKNDSDIREAISNETQARISQHEEISRRVQENSADIQQAQRKIDEADNALEQEISGRKQDNDAEILQRVEYDEALQVQINQLANSILQNAITFRDSIERRKLEIKQEILTGSKNDEDLHARLNESLITCGMLQAQIDSLVSAVFQANSNLLAVIEIHRRDFAFETQLRKQDAESFQSQIDSNSQAGLNNAIAIHREAEERRKLLARLIQEKQDREIQIQALRAEIGQLYEIPLPGLSDDLASIHNEAENNANANLRNSVTIAREIDTRRKDFLLLKQEISDETQLRMQNDSALQSQIDSAVQSILKNALILSKTFSHSREALSQEAFTRYEQDAGILRQTNQLAHAVLRLAVQQHQTSRRVSEIETGEAQAPGQIATDSEFDEMLDELYQNP